MLVSTYFIVLLALTAPVLAKHKGRGKGRGKGRHGRGHCAVGVPNKSTPPTSTKAPEPTETQPVETSASCSGNSCYKTTNNYVGRDFLDSGDWEFFSRNDPTHGRVDYVDSDRARSTNLTYASDDTFIMRVESEKQLDSSGPGRESVRINTKKMYKTHVSVFDVRHMPFAETAWPAFWTVGNDWPNNGELDIIEHISNDELNLMSLHTSDGCMQPEGGQDGREMSGTMRYDNCHASGPKGNQGCGVHSTNPKSVGAEFNAVNGGWYVTERTSTSIKVWIWPRDAEDVPADVRAQTGRINTDNFGTPTAAFVNSQCDLDQKFGPHEYVINTTLCGDWAGNRFHGGMAKCDEFVNRNPEVFKNAYWDIARLTIYERD